MKRKYRISFSLLSILLTSCETYSGHVECPSLPEGVVYYDGCFADSGEKSFLFPLKADEGLQERDVDSVTLSLSTVYQSAETTFSLEAKEEGYLLRIDCPENMDKLDTVTLRIGGKDYSYPVNVLYYEIESEERSSGSLECLSFTMEETPEGKKEMEAIYRVHVEEDGILGAPHCDDGHPLRWGKGTVVSTSGEKVTTSQYGASLRQGETYFVTITCEASPYALFYNENVPFPFTALGKTKYLVPENESISNEILLEEVDS